MKIKMYEIIEVLLEKGVSKYCLALFPAYETQEEYYRIYKVIRQKNLPRKRGYLRRLLKDPDVNALLPKDWLKADKWDTDNLRWLIRVMEKVYYV